MATQKLERQFQSVQRNIEFLRKEQLELLHGLNLEILHLQKRCTELTQELQSKHVELAQQGQFEQEMEEKCRIIEAKYNEKEQLNSALKLELCHREKRVATLRSKLRDKERRFLDELKRRSHRVTILNTELQKQTESAAYLSFQLHITKQKLHSPQHSCHEAYRPPDFTVPRQPHHEGKVKRRTHKNHSAWRQTSENPSGKDLCRDTCLRERMSSFDDVEAMPDPALFLYPKRYMHSQRQKSEPKSHSLKKTGSGHADGVVELSTQWPDKLLKENDDTSSTIPVVKAKLPKSERGKRRVVPRQNSRDSE
ncbi:coiled-coil domain-containing protein 92 [Bombina bombina]|uniref:coiled-coil domain-containing protein 92 n=1 Tax=Bombina bombina TaxID=8345 RepID=UPI00235A8845|nr:coiled-coil domain-containing protein 92 [Bombina bombina]